MTKQLTNSERLARVEEKTENIEQGIKELKQSVSDLPKALTEQLDNRYSKKEEFVRAETQLKTVIGFLSVIGVSVVGVIIKLISESLTK